MTRRRLTYSICLAAACGLTGFGLFAPRNELIFSNISPESELEIDALHSINRAEVDLEDELIGRPDPRPTDARAGAASGNAPLN